MDTVTEVLAAHAEQLNHRSDPGPGGFGSRDRLLASLPAQREEVEPLFDLAERVKRTLKPVKPAPAFRARLYDGLMLAAHHQQAQQIYIARRGEPQWGWLLGAAAAAGILAMVWRSRGQEHRTPETVGEESSSLGI